MVESPILDAVDAQDGIERTALTFVGEFDPVDVVRSSTRLFGDLEHVLGRDVNEFGLRIDEAPDQPRTSDAVDLRVLSRHPFARRRAYRPVCWQTFCDPAFNAVLQVDCIDPCRAKGSGHTLAALMPMHAVHDPLASAGQVRPPALDVIGRPMERRYDELACLCKI